MKSRIKAFGVHLSISLIIFLLVLLVVYCSWFPGGLLSAGALQGLKIVIFVDLVLGPLLTFIVFNKKKKSLKWDLAAIAVLQFSCLVYGLMQMEQQRIASLVLMDDQLFIVHKMDLEQAGFDVSVVRDEFGDLPVLAFYNLPENPAAIKTDLQIIANLEGQPQYQIDHYIPTKKALADDYIQERLQWRLNRLTYNKEDDCYWVAVDDKFVSGKACFAPHAGVRRLVLDE